jgi:hypothetical protein
MKDVFYHQENATEYFKFNKLHKRMPLSDVYLESIMNSALFSDIGILVQVKEHHQPMLLIRASTSNRYNI